MEFVSPDDYVEIRQLSVLTDFDRKILTELYQPLVGHAALALFLTLWAEREQAYPDIITHDRLFALTQMSAGEFQKARYALEAVGLVKSYFREANKFRMFVYELYAPKMPRAFFDDALFNGLLIKYLGEKEAARIKASFKVDDPGEGTEVSAHFADVYKPDLDDPVFRLAGKNKAAGRLQGGIDYAFDFNLFFEGVENRGFLKKSAFDKQALKEIERLAALYGIDESTMADHVLSAYHPEAAKDQRIDFYYLGELCREDSRYVFARKKPRKANLPTSQTAIAEKVKLMESVSPKDYLRYMQNNTSPANADLLLVNDLSLKFGLPTSVINALVDYVISINDNVLSRALTEKIAASLAREQVMTAIDTMNYLRKIKKGRKTTPEPTSAPSQPAVPSETPKASESTPPDADLSEILKKYQKKGDPSHG